MYLINAQNFCKIREAVLEMQAQHIKAHVPKVTGEVYLSVREVWMSFMKCAPSANKVFSTRAARDFHECMRENV